MMTSAFVFGVIFERRSSRSGIQRLIRRRDNAPASGRQASPPLSTADSRRRQQHLVAVVEAALHGHHDQLGRTVTNVDVIQFERPPRPFAGCNA